MATPLTPVEQSVLEKVNSKFDDTIQFLCDLVRQPSTLGNERGAQEVVFHKLQGIGLQSEMWDLDLEALRKHPSFGTLDLGYKDRPNVTAVLKAAAQGGRSVIFNGHVDVVSAEPLSNWTHPPYEPTIEGDWIYGRGAGDMKAGVAAMILAVEAVKSTGVGLRGDVTLESVIEEECTGNGTLACALHGLKADAALVPEPHALTASHATVGVIWFRVRARGRASHVQAANTAINAIERMIPVIAALRQLETELNAEKRHPLYQEIVHPINLNVGIIRSGDWPSTVPSECSIECRLSCLPGMSVDELQGRVRVAIQKLSQADERFRENPPELEFFGFRAEPSVVDPSAPAMQVLADCHQSVLHTELAFHPGTATTDERFFLNNLGVPAAAYGPAAERIHAGEERVLVPSVKQTAQVLALYLLRWCGVVS